ncbi:hypothetical protein [Hydrogenophaga sp.]|nr:hypothetical protein [Hydrogenophaga sp.]MDM7950010.1 hypothetical protein [Hydrogenophaga sp.]
MENRKSGGLRVVAVMGTLRQLAESERTYANVWTKIIEESGLRPQ